MDGSPFLQELRIYDHGPMDNGSESTRISTLSRLSPFEMNNCYSRFILSHLKLLPSTNLIVEDSAYPLDDYLVDDNFLPFFQAIPDDAAMVEMLDGATSFEISIKEMVSLDVPSLAHPRLLLSVYEDSHDELHDPTTLHSLLCSLRRHPMFAPATRLANKFGYTFDVDEFYNITEQDWKLSFSGLPNLEQLVLHECITSSLLIALGSRSDHDDTAMICPRLRSLQLRECIWPDRGLDFYLERLDTLIEARTKGGCPIRELHDEIWCFESDHMHERSSQFDYWGSTF